MMSRSTMQPQQWLTVTVGLMLALSLVAETRRSRHVHDEEFRQEHMHDEHSTNSACRGENYRLLSASLKHEHQCLLLEMVQKEMQLDKGERNNYFNTIVSLLISMEHKLEIIANDGIRERNDIDWKKAGQAIQSNFATNRDMQVQDDCEDYLLSGFNTSGVYPIRIPDGKIVNVYCDMESDGGGWTLFQRRVDGSTNFTRNWNDYKDGFGNVNSEFWLGNDKIYQLSNSKNYSMRVDLWDWGNGTAFAQYQTFRIDNENENFRLTVDGYSGTAGDSLNNYHNQSDFSTPDSDNDRWFGECAVKDKAGWWFNDCSYASLNSVYYHGGKHAIAPDGLIDGILWYHWKQDYTYSLRKTEMKIRSRK